MFQDADTSTIAEIDPSRVDVVINAAIRSASKVTGLRTGDDTVQVAIAILNLAATRLHDNGNPEG